MMHADKIIKTIEQHCGVEIPKTGILAGGAVANTIAFLQGVTDRLVINDIDIFRTASPLEREAFKQVSKEGEEYELVPKLVATERKGVFNYTSRSFMSDVRDLINDFDINACQAGINLETRTLEVTPEFQQFLKTKQVEVLRFHSAALSVNRMIKKANQLGAYYSKLQSEAIIEFAKQAKSGVVEWKDVKMWVSDKRNSLAMEEIALMVKIGQCSKVQKQNIINFIGDSPKAGSRMKMVIELILKEKREISPSLLSSIKKMVVGKEHSQDFSQLLNRATSEFAGKNYTFTNFAEIAMEAKRLDERFKFVWGLLSERDVLSAVGLRKAIAKKLRESSEKWPQLYFRNPAKTPDFTIRELKSSKELMVEGAEMGHCVGGYAYSCMSEAKTRIFAVTMADGKKYTLDTSLVKFQQRDEHGQLQLATGRRLSQFKGRFNEKPDNEHYDAVIKYLIEKKVVIERFEKEYESRPY